MEPELTTREEVMLIGIEVRTANQEEMPAATAKIAALWKRFYQDQIAEKIPNRKPGGALLGVYTRYESDHTRPYTLVIGMQVTGLDSIPKSMTGLSIPGGEYLAFPARGPMPQALIDTWIYIWNYFSGNTSYQRAYTTDYEVHLGSDGADIYIAVK
jgi:predicted transcriptional regulator YdeE